MWLLSHLWLLALQTPTLPCQTPPQGMRCVVGGVVTVGTNSEHICQQSENQRQHTRFGPAMEVTVKTIFVDETEVTNAAYQACVKQRRCTPGGPQYRDFREDEQPITALSWWQARAFCVAQGKRLPTEAEWEHAAGSDDEPSCPQTWVMSDRGRSCGVPMNSTKHPDKGRVARVKSTPQNPHGLYEMRGNAEEWVDDWFSPQRDPSQPAGPCAGLDRCPRAPLKMVKGGSWYWPASDAHAWHRRPYKPDNQPAHHFGFRCVKDLSTP
jgi:formylglycine-generating enzyme